MTTPTSLIFVRPGLASHTWSYAGASLPSGGVDSAVSYVAFDASSLAGQAFSRGDLQYSTDNGRNWSSYTLPLDGSGAYVAANGTLWRFQDRAGSDSATPDSFTAHYKLADGSVFAQETIVAPDTQPVGLSGASDTVFSTMAAGAVVDVLSGIDVGAQTGGRWVIDAQSNAGLFNIVFDRASDSSAKLVIANPAQIPQPGSAVSVTLHYYDRYQVDANGNPIGTGGVTRTLNYSVEDGNTDSLAGMSNGVRLGAASGAYSAGPALAATGAGFVAVWQAPDGAAGGALWAQWRDNAGNAKGAAFALTPAGDGVSEGEPSVTALAGGRFAVAYTVQSGAAHKLAYRVVEANGSVGAEHVLDTAGDAGMATLATLADGSFALGWRSNGAVHVQQVGVDGNAAGPAQHFAVLGTAYSPSLAALGQGWVVSWGEIGDGNVHAALNGGAAFVASGDGYAASITTAAPLPHVTALAGGGFVVAWDSYVNDQRGFSISDIFFQRFDSAGHALGEMVQANVESGGGRYDAAVTALSDGGFLLAWQGADGDANGVYGRRFGADGAALDVSEFALNPGRGGDQTAPDVKALAGGGFAAAWVDSAADGSASVEVRVLPGSGIETAAGSAPSGGGAATTPAAPVKVVVGGSEKYIGSAGLDTLAYGGASAAYTIGASGAGYVVAGTSGTTVLNDVERLKFSDQMVALDIAGNAGEAYRLYQAAFNRTPDKAGLGFWIGALDQGQSLHAAAENFIGSAEFARMYGANTSDNQFVDALYQNVLHRAPDAAGYAFWVGVIHDTTRADVLVGFSESGENQAQVIGAIQNGIGYLPWE